MVSDGGGSSGGRWGSQGGSAAARGKRDNKAATIRRERCSAGHSPGRGSGAWWAASWRRNRERGVSPGSAMERRGGERKKGVRLAWHGAHVGRAPRAVEWGVEHVVRVAGSGRVRSDDACGRRKNRESEAIERDRLGVGSSDREKRWVDRPEGGAQLVGKEREKGQLPWPLV
jgi:hypothetical protein